MKNLKIFFALLSIIFIGFISFGRFTTPKVEDIGSGEFSAERVARDIKSISKEPHSIEHPEARARVRNYLFDRLDDMGGDPVIYSYDDIESKFGGSFDIGNVYCQYEPKNGKASSYVMLIAHLDSRYAQPTLKDTVYSYGAADDGYGLGVILELLSQALKYRNHWDQGVKILFTDSEEHDLDGMRNALEHNNELFEDVGLVFNIEARGVKGPALMFETSLNNSKLMELYQQAELPYAYSLTSVVYRILPNFTDFTLLKDEYPGYNFSVIDNLHYYHTEKDNYSNISLESIQHYGDQIEPMLKEYLTNKSYSNPDYLKAETDDVFFTIAGLWTVVISKQMSYVWTFVITGVFLLALVLHLLSSSVRLNYVLRSAFWIFLASIGILLIGEGIAYLSALIFGAKFDIVSTRFIKYDYLISILSILSMVFFYLIFFVKKTSSRYFNLENTFGALLLLVIYSLVLLFMVGENFFFMIPVLLASIALIFFLFLFLNFISLFALLGIVLLQFSFLYLLLTALTIGSLGVIMFMAFYNLVLIMGLFECFLNQKR